MRRLAMAAWLACVALAGPTAASGLARRAIPREHPRILGDRRRLRELARQRPDAYRRVVRVARRGRADDHAKMISMALVCAIESDGELGRGAVELAMKYVRGPIRKGHCTFGHDLARCGIVYDLCHAFWTAGQRQAFHAYVNRTVDANVRSETAVFHNGWYGYKAWGIGIACYASYHENPRAETILAALERDYRRRAAPALALAGEGGGWAEGYYIHYWLYEWLFFCEVARLCGGVDLLAAAPAFYRHRAVASVFEMYPPLREYGSRRAVPMGDGGGRHFGGERDKALAARQILVGRFRDDPAHRAVHAFNETTARCSVGVYAYKDFLWRDAGVSSGDVRSLGLSHVSPGPGHVHARSDWSDGATYFFFTCGDRFTAHQHLDVGHFVIFRHAELAGDGGHYDGFGTSHDVNYHLRTIAHSTMLVHDPAERWPGIRAGAVTGNDGGQHHDWPHHNGSVLDPAAWRKGKKRYDIADLVAFRDAGAWLYVAGDCTRAYSPKKMALFTRQIVYIRPGTFVIFDRVRSRRADLAKTWLLQAMAVPMSRPPHRVVTHGKGRLFVQTLLPAKALVREVHGEALYRYGGRSYPPKRDTGLAPRCRIEVSPGHPARTDYFLHVLTATDSTVAAVPPAVATDRPDEVAVTVGQATVTFRKTALAGRIALAGRREQLPTTQPADGDRPRK